MWEIDKDLIFDNEDAPEMSRVGTTGEVINVGLGPIASEWIALPTTKEKTRFHMRDDDGEIYYCGWLHNDSEGLNQQAALAYGMADAGCTTIEVNVEGKWVQEIG